MLSCPAVARKVKDSKEIGQQRDRVYTSPARPALASAAGACARAEDTPGIGHTSARHGTLLVPHRRAEETASWCVMQLSDDVPAGTRARAGMVEHHR